MQNKNKIIYGLALLIIIIGIIVVVTKGFNVGLDYMPSQKIEIYIGKEFELNDIKNIANEVFGNQQVSIKKIELFEDMLSITSKEISEEQKNNFIQKLSEKYDLETEAESIDIVSVPNIKLTDIAKKYIFPIAISFAIILIYIGIRFAKINSFKVILESVLNVGIIELLFASVLAIGRIPVGRFVIPVALAIYVLVIFCLMNKFEKQLSNKKIEEESK